MKKPDPRIFRCLREAIWMNDALWLTEREATRLRREDAVVSGVYPVHMDRTGRGFRSVLRRLWSDYRATETVSVVLPMTHKDMRARYSGGGLP